MGKSDRVKEKIIFTRIGKVILTRRRYDCNKDRQSDIDEAKRQGEEYNREMNRRGEENCNKEKEKTITKRRCTLILKKQVAKRRQPLQEDETRIRQLQRGVSNQP